MNISQIINVQKRLSPYLNNIPLQYSSRLSDKFNANIYLKREDLQPTRSFKIRGSLNKILKEYELNPSLKVVCASAGNHAQGVAFACNLLGIQGDIFVPTVTPLQKQNRIKYYGKNNINLKIEGQNFNETLEMANYFSNKNKYTFIHPYDDLDIIEGQSTIGYEILQELEPDIVLSTIGGGGLVSGLGDTLSSKTQIIGCEPEGADSMSQALRYGKPIKIKNLDNFVDGASVDKVGENTFLKCKTIFKNQENIKVISNPHICHELMNCYQEDGIILEPAGVLSICALDMLNLKDITNKNIVCVLSGGNNDVSRYPEILEKNLLYLNRKHYYVIEFAQKPKELKKFIMHVLGQNDDITRFEYIKKTNKFFGNVLLGIETKNNHNLEKNMLKYDFKFKKIDENDLIYSYLI